MGTVVVTVRAEWIIAWREVRRVHVTGHAHRREAVQKTSPLHDVATRCWWTREAPELPLPAREWLVLWSAYRAWRSADQVTTWSVWKKDLRSRSVAMQALASAARKGYVGAAGVTFAAEILRRWVVQLAPSTHRRSS